MKETYLVGALFQGASSGKEEATLVGFCRPVV